MIAHRPSVSEREPQGWIINWMTDRLAAYQFRELESTEQFSEQIFWTNHFTEDKEIQFSKKNCRPHHYILRVMVCLEGISSLPSLVAILRMFLRPTSSTTLMGHQSVAISFTMAFVSFSCLCLSILLPHAASNLVCQSLPPLFVLLNDLLVST